MRQILFILIVLTLASCSRYQKIMKDGTPQEKLDAAQKYYGDKDYLRAQPLLEELLGLYNGRKEREEIYYLYSYSYFATEDFLLAGYHFNNFATTYALSPKKEEALYMSAVCKYKKAMPTELDQTPTQNAISALQTFINQYPNSGYVSECNTKMDELRMRLLKKVYENAKLYHSLGYYNSAMVACQNAVEDYPDMINRDELTFLMVDAAYLFAQNSIEKKQLERYSETLMKVKEFNKEFDTDSKYSKPVLKINIKTEAAIAELNKE
jgi:outer membrane protein assembly factor BamD